MSLSEKSDYEINELVAKILYPDSKLYKSSICDGVLTNDPDDYYNWVNYDALAFRLMINNGIYLQDGGALWEAIAFKADGEDSGDIICGNKNPNRAICETFIMMSEGKDDKAN